MYSVRSWTLCIFVLAWLSAMIAPLLHWLPLPEKVDRAIASVLDELEPKWASLFAGSLLRSTGWTVFLPEGYHGPGTWTTSGSVDKGFFEGWYYKMVTKYGRTLVVIPGVIYGPSLQDNSGETGGFSFVMVADPAREGAERVQLHRYTLDSVAASHTRDGWKLQIGPNTFSSDAISLALNSSNHHLEGEVAMLRSSPWPTTLLLPDVMGWFAWIPGMECRHGVLSLHSSVQGAMRMDGEEVAMDGGAAYIEKDWGGNFPKTWIWMQANHFELNGGDFQEASFMLSIASIPFPSDQLEAFRFRGFLGGLWLPHLGGLFRFATYTGAVIEHVGVSGNQSHVHIMIRDAQYHLMVTAKGDRQAAALLHGPMPGGKFEPFVHEMLDASITVELQRRSDGKVLWEGRSAYAGLEIESMEAGGIHLLETIGA